MLKVAKHKQTFKYIKNKKIKNTLAKTLQSQMQAKK